MDKKPSNKGNLKHDFIVVGILLGSLFLIFVIFYNLHFFRPSLENVKDSVVMIEVYDKNGELMSTGSGFCAYEEDIIVTNFHVIEGGSSFKIITDDKYEYSVDKVILFNKKDDLALLQINGELDKLSVRSKDGLSVKDKVTAIGSPKGELNTVSEGIVSNIDDEDLIRISVPISHGSSGGVLLNEQYQVVGITNAGYDDADSLNFAIRSQILTKMYESYKNEDYYSINETNYTWCAPNIVNYNTKNTLRIKDNCSYSNSNNYKVDSLNTFYLATNSFEIYNTILLNQENMGFDKFYKKLTNEEKVLASEYYIALLEFEDCDENEKDSCSIDNISKWNKEQMVMELDVMPTYALSIFKIQIKKYNSKNVFNYVNSLPLDIPQKGILILLYGGYKPNDLSNTDANKVIKYINDLDLTIEEKGKISSYLGYTVKGSNVSW